MSNVALIVAYDGTPYHGFQLQPRFATVQGELEGALLQLSGEAIRVIGASRTDSGAHAQGQVVNFRTKVALPLRAYVRGLNALLPEAIRVEGAAQMPEGFHARRSAVRREYRYSVYRSYPMSPFWRRYAHHEPGALDLAAMERGAQWLLSQASASSGSSQGYALSVSEAGPWLCFDVSGRSFLPHQIRRIAGALLAVGKGKLAGEELPCLWSEAPVRSGRSWRWAVVPARGLCLVRVRYPPPYAQCLEKGA